MMLFKNHVSKIFCFFFLLNAFALADKTTCTDAVERFVEAIDVNPKVLDDLAKVTRRPTKVIYAERPLPERVVETLGRVAYIHGDRTEYGLEFLRRYKNDDAFANFVDAERDVSQVRTLRKWERTTPSGSEERPPRFVDLDSPGTKTRPDFQERLKSSGDTEARSIDFTDYIPTEYEYLVLGLRKGDKIRVGGKVVVLGKFLGAGNSTHIFELAEQPGKVIRIPFVTQYLLAGARRRPNNLEVIRSYVDIYFDKIPQMLDIKFKNGRGFNFLKPEEGARGINDSYIIMPRVQGSENGSQFMQRIRNNIDSLSPEDKERVEKLAEQLVFKQDIPGPQSLLAEELASMSEAKRFEELEKLKAEKIQAIFELSQKQSGSMLQSEAGQFLWDEDNKLWILVDFE